MNSPVYIDKKPRLSPQWRLVLLAIAAVAATLAFHYGGGRPESQGVTQASAPAGDIGDLSNAHSGALPKIAPVLPALLPAETRAQHFDRLAHGTPAEALEALKLLVPCDAADYARRLQSQPTGDDDNPAWRQQQDAEQAKLAKEGDAGCVSITGGQRSQAIELALKAARAGVPGGFDELVRQDWLSSMDTGVRDPRLVDSMPAIQAAYAKAGDPRALLGLSNFEDPLSCSSACSPYLSLVHWTAFVDTGSNHNPDTVTPRLAQLLTPEQVQAAVTEGHALYANRTTK